jgi:hypothetical protein
VVQEGFSAKYQHAEVSSRPSAVSFDDVRAAMIASQRVQSRTYGSRTLRLFPDIWLYAEPATAPQPIRGFAVEDGDALCLFVLVGPRAPRVVKLQPGDFVSVIREA